MTQTLQEIPPNNEGEQEDLNDYQIYYRRCFTTNNPSTSEVVCSEIIRAGSVPEAMLELQVLANNEAMIDKIVELSPMNLMNTGGDDD